MNIEDTVSEIQHYNKLILNTKDAVDRQRLTRLQQNIISKFISADERRYPRKEPNV